MEFLTSAIVPVIEPLVVSTPTLDAQTHSEIFGTLWINRWEGNIKWSLAAALSALDRTPRPPVPIRAKVSFREAIVIEV